MSATKSFLNGPGLVMSRKGNDMDTRLTHPTTEEKGAINTGYRRIHSVTII